MKEEWKVYHDGPIVKYEVNKDGKVKKNNKEIIPRISNCGYLCVGRYLVHRMVAEMFVPNPENKPQVDHIDGNKLNNKDENLRWVTAKENINNPVTIINRQGENNSMFGKHRSEEFKKQQSKRMSGENNPNFGKKQSQETIQKRVNKLLGHRNWSKSGHVPTKEQRQKQSEKMRNKHRVYDNAEHTKWHMENN